MLESIKVKNVALIEDAEITFTEGLNILTGETGAGKSILLSSVKLSLGAKADKSLIRTGEEYAFVELVFVPNADEVTAIKALDLELEDDVVILQRRVYPTKSICKFNGETVTLKTMQSIAELLIDIHGQREHQSILKTSHQESMLDAYGKDVMMVDLDQMAKTYQTYNETKRAYEECIGTDRNSEKELDFAKFQLDEIDKANLQLGEDDALEAQFDKLSNAQKLMEEVSTAKGILNQDSSACVLTQLSMARKSIDAASQMDQELLPVAEAFAEAEDILVSNYHVLDQYMDRISMQGDDLHQVTERLNLINHLKGKYGHTIEDIMAYADSLREQIAKLEDYDAYVLKLETAYHAAQKDYQTLAQKLHEKRTKLAIELSEEMQHALHDLNFEQCHFVIETNYDDARVSAKGSTDVTFMISMNPGEAQKPLSQVASGGELSRIMLAFKSVFADKDQMSTLVFDEIDSGISGKTAWKVSEKLALLRKEHQVICITHLPQIAAMADTHFMIEKQVANEHTKTLIHHLDEAHSIEEIGRLLGTDQLTDAVLLNATELKKQADEVKTSIA